MRYWSKFVFGPISIIVVLESYDQPYTCRRPSYTLILRIDVITDQTNVEQDAAPYIITYV